MGGRASSTPLEAWDESGLGHDPCHILSQDVAPAGRRTYSGVSSVARWTMGIPECHRGVQDGADCEPVPPVGIDTVYKCGSASARGLVSAFPRSLIGLL